MGAAVPRRGHQRQHNMAAARATRRGHHQGGREMSDFAPHIGTVAKAVWGDPNTRLSSRHELRFGTNGSKSVDLRKGVWRDHERGEDGGLLDLLRVHKGLTNAAAFEYLRGLGVDMPRRDEPRVKASPGRV